MGGRDMTLDEARELVNGPLWPKVRDEFLATGTFAVYGKGDLRRLGYLEPSVRAEIELWLKAIPQLDSWRTVIDGKAVRQLKADYPGVYPEALRYQPYFAGAKDVTRTLLKIKFPEAYRLCYS